MNLVTYLKQSRDELKKVTWPTRQETIKHTSLVVGVSVFVALLLGGMDAILSQILSYVVLK